MTDQPTESRALANPAEQRQIHRVENVQPMLDSSRFEHMQRAASALMHSTLLPESIRGDAPQQCFSNMMLVLDLSERWKLPPLAIAQCIAIVHNKIVYEGKLIQAMLESSLGVRLHHYYTGQRGTLDYRVFISDRPFAELVDQTLPAVEQAAAIAAILQPGVQIPGWRIIDGSVGEWRTFKKNSTTEANPAWTGAATRNQLAYRGNREWARLYEPGPMLGVYGEDEIDDITVRMERARDITPTAPGLSTGFTRPAPVANSIEASHTPPSEEEVKAAFVATRRAAEGVQAAKGPQDPQEGAQDAQVGEAAPVEAEKPKRLSKAERDAEKARAAQALAEQEKENKIRDEAIEREQAQADELEAAFEAGLNGGVIVCPEGATDEHWQALNDEWARGAGQREADEAQNAAAGSDAVDADLGDDDDHAFPGDKESALDAIAQAEPGMVDQALEDDDDATFDQEDAIDIWSRNLEALDGWPAIKASLSALSKSDAWKASSPDRIAQVRAAAWRHEAQLIEAGRDRFDFLNDITAFRCWVETTDDVDAINGNWMSLVRMPIFTGLPDDRRAGLERAVLARVEKIQGDAPGE